MGSSHPRKVWSRGAALHLLQQLAKLIAEWDAGPTHSSATQIVVGEEGLAGGRAGVFKNTP